MKKRFLSLTLALTMLLGTAAALPQDVLTQSTGITASAQEAEHEYKNVDGGIEKNYSKEYKATILIYGRPECYNTRSTITEASKMALNKDINVVFVDIDQNNKDRISEFKKDIDVTGVKFCYDESDNAYSHAWYYITTFHDKTKTAQRVLPYVAFFNSKGEVVNASTAKLDYGYLAAYAKKCGADIEGYDLADKEELNFEVTYQQKDARQILEKVNDLRTGNNAWAWNTDNTEKIACTGLDKLTYDYELEKVAMQRAAELVVLYSHTRPNTERCFTAYPSSLNGYCGENIAIGYTSMESVFEAWEEENEDYSGQGHRRNMLNGNFRSIGVAHVKYDGYDYWVQEFSSNVVDTKYKEPNENDTKVTVELNHFILDYDMLVSEKDIIDIIEGDDEVLPDVVRIVSLKDQYRYAPSLYLDADVNWSVEVGKDVIKLSGNKIIPLKAGKAVLTAAYKNKTVNVDVSVEHKWSDWTTTKAATCSATGNKTRKCSICGKVENQTIETVEHKWSDWKVTKNETCVTDGERIGTCSVCGKTCVETIEATGHDWEIWPEVIWNGGKEATIIFECENDHSHQTQLIGSVETKPVSSATCLSSGQEDVIITFTLENSEYTITQKHVIPKLDHKVSSWKNTSFNVDDRTMIQTGTCSECGKTQTRSIPNAVVRLAGRGRYATAAEISKAAFADKADTVVLAYSMNYADALAGVPLAYKNDAPILLTNTRTLDATTLAEIKRLKAKNVIILGGEGAIGKEVEDALAKEDITTQRIAGKTRYGTATAIAKELNKAREEVFFVYGLGYADALSVSTVAAVRHAPIIYLTKNGSLNTDTAAYLADLKKEGSVRNAYVIGGEGVITDDMMNKAAIALGLDKTTRVAGANRFETCVEVNDKFKSVLTGDKLCIATGMDFPDALAGGVFAAKNKAPLFLINGKLKAPKLTNKQKAYLKSKKTNGIAIFGGEGVVPDSHIKDIANNSI